MPAYPPEGQILDKFADIKIGSYNVDGFERLSPSTRKLLYYLSRAGLAGRDIFWDQKYRYNLLIRKCLNGIVQGFKGDRESDEFARFLVYAKRVWFSSGIHHHNSSIKIPAEFGKSYWRHLLQTTSQRNLPVKPGFELKDLLRLTEKIIFDPETAAVGTATAGDEDLLLNSAVNFYRNVSQEEAESFYARRSNPDDPRPLSLGLNSRLEKRDGRIFENVYHANGLYGEAIRKIIYWLQKAIKLAPTENFRQQLAYLIEFYRDGDLHIWDQYSIEWLKDRDSGIYFVNGFIETYNDPLAMRGSYESIVGFRDEEATRRVQTISGAANWFEENSPIADEFKREDIPRMSGEAITVVSLAGDAAPNPPIGINLPNANWIRSAHGSRSVTLTNISRAYASIEESSGILEEFAASEAEIQRARQYGALARTLHTDMHEIIGHGSGKIKAGVAPPRETLKNYAAVIEETRADLVAYYFALDPYLIELGLVPNFEVGKAAYDRAIRNGFLQQLVRVKRGENLSQAHMMNRQLIAHWAFELGREHRVVERKHADGKTAFVINDYEKLRAIFGSMLQEIQRITSEGDFEAARRLVNRFAVYVDSELHNEVLRRIEKLNYQPFTGFVIPEIVSVAGQDQASHYRLEYPPDFLTQMLAYDEKYAALPAWND